MSVDCDKGSVSVIGNGLCETVSVRVDLICGISTNDMHDGLVAARMILEPRIDFEDLAVKNDDRLTIGYHALDLSSSQNGFLAIRSDGGAVIGKSHCGRKSDARLMKSW